MPEKGKLNFNYPLRLYTPRSRLYTRQQDTRHLSENIFLSTTIKARNESTVTRFRGILVMLKSSGMFQLPAWFAAVPRPILIIYYHPSPPSMQISVIRYTGNCNELSNFENIREWMGARFPAISICN